MPLVPFFPLVSVFVNFYLMSVLNKATWVRFAVWMTIGFIIYFCYGVRNSSENISYMNRSINNGDDIESNDDINDNNKSIVNPNFIKDE